MTFRPESVHKSLPFKLAKGMNQLLVLNQMLRITRRHIHNYNSERVCDEIDRIKLRVESLMINFEKFEKDFELMYYTDTPENTPEKPHKPL